MCFSPRKKEKKKKEHGLVAYRTKKNQDLVA